MFDQQLCRWAILILLALPSWTHSQTPAPREVFSASAVVADKLVQFSTANQPKADLHAVLCCEDEMNPDSVITHRTERAAVYRGNFLGGAGFTLLIHGFKPDGWDLPKAELAKQWLRKGTYHWAQPGDHGTDGWELVYKDSTGKRWTTVHYQEPRGKIRIVRTTFKPGQAVGGFGSYEYILEVTGNGVLTDDQSKFLAFTNLRMRIGMWAEGTAPRN